MPSNENSDTKNNQSKGLIEIYKQAVKNVPFLKYGWVIIATICILALAASFQLNKKDVFLYALGVLGISFLGYIFSYLLKTKDKFIRILLYFLISCIVLTIGLGVISFASYLFFQKPKIYDQVFNNNIKDETGADLQDTSSRVPIVRINTDSDSAFAKSYIEALLSSDTLSIEKHSLFPNFNFNGKNILNSRFLINEFKDYSSVFMSSANDLFATSDYIFPLFPPPGLIKWHENENSESGFIDSYHFIAKKTADSCSLKLKDDDFIWLYYVQNKKYLITGEVFFKKKEGKYKAFGLGTIQPTPIDTIKKWYNDLKYLEILAYRKNEIRNYKIIEPVANNSDIKCNGQVKNMVFKAVDSLSRPVRSYKLKALMYYVLPGGQSLAKELQRFIDAHLMTDKNGEITFQWSVPMSNDLENRTVQTDSIGLSICSDLTGKQMFYRKFRLIK